MRLSRLSHPSPPIPPGYNPPGRPQEWGAGWQVAINRELIEESMDRKIIDDFENGGEKLRRAIEGLSATELLWVPPRAAEVGLWTIQQVVLHLMDDELIWTARMKSVIAQERPKIM